MSYLVVMMICASSSLSSPVPSPDFTSNPLVDVVIGGIIASVASLIGIYLTNRQQFKRDQQANQQQIEREQVAYARSLKDAKRERLRRTYKVIYDAALQYRSVLSELGYVLKGETEEDRDKRLNLSLRNKLTGVDEAIVEITLEDVGIDVKTIFDELSQAFIRHRNTSASAKQFPGSFTPLELDEQLHKAEDIVNTKVDELEVAMKRHLKELES